MSTRGRAIILVGFMGAGKSSVGRELERRTALPRFETDEMVEAKLNLSIPQIFERDGEEFFREAESEVLRSLDPNQPAIIVTGGGIVLRASNREKLHELGTIIYLQANEETLFARIALQQAVRPLLRGDLRETMKQLLEKRLPLYEELADLTIETSHLASDEVCDSILKELALNERSS